MKFTINAILLLVSGSTIYSRAETCITGGGWSFRVKTNYNVDDENGNDAQCSYDVLLDAFEDKVFNEIILKDDSCTNSVEDEFLAQLGVTTTDEAETAVYALCGEAQDKVKKIPISDVTYSEGSQFIEIYYSGHGSWNEETETKLYPGDTDSPFNVLKQDARRVKTYYEYSQEAVFEMPNLPQFEPDLCTAKAAMCCWPRDRQANDNNGNCDDPYDEKCIDKDVADNTDLCYVELTHAPYANGIDADGFSLFPNDNNHGEGPIHCHGFAWANDDKEILSRYKANNLFYVSMYDHMYQRGYVENIPGAPMCGCVEHMPVVSRSDCTQTNLEEYYIFTKKYGDTGFNGVLDHIKLEYQACQGANNNNNDLTAFVQQLVNDGKLSTHEQDIYSQRVVGNNQCNNAITDVLTSYDFKKGFNVDTSKWTYIVGEQFDDIEPIYADTTILKAMFEAQPEDFRIVRRACPTCSESHRDVYYKRLTPMPDDFDLLDTLMNNWFDEGNELDVDFSLYSSYMDAYYDENRWTFCNFNDPGIGFPRDCGPTGRVNHNWNSYNRGGGRANHHAFMIPSNSSFESSIIFVKGVLDNIVPKANHWIANGWACAVGDADSIDVHIYVDGPAGSGNYVAAATANRTSEEAVANICKTNATNYRFSVEIPKSGKVDYVGKGVFVHAIAGFPLHNPLIGRGAGQLTFSDVNVDGHLDSVMPKANHWMANGWACAVRDVDSIDVHTYVGGPAGSGSFVAAATANRTSGGGVASRCKTSGTNYRFSIEIPYSGNADYVGKGVFVHAIAGFRNPLIGRGAGQLTFSDVNVDGHLDSVISGANHWMANGWACAVGDADSIDVHTYVGGPAGSGTYVVAATANRTSEVGVASRCKTSGANYRFSVEIPKSGNADYVGKGVFVHAIAGFRNPLIGRGAGQLTFS